MSAAIKIRGMTVRYGELTAVSELDLEVRRGEIFGFLGPNGAGKTTTIRALLDLLRPEAGEVAIFGRPVAGGPGRERARIGFLPGDLTLFPVLTGRETLQLFENLYRVPVTRREETLDRLGFPRDALDRRTRSYSTGMRQMLGITCALQHDPELLILDEPTTGLDPLVRESLLTLLRGLASRDRTVLFSSHALAEVESCADRVGLIHRGRLHLVDDMAALRRRFPRRVRLVYGDGRRRSFSHEGPPAELLAKIDTDGLVDLEIRAANLADVFRSVVKGESAE